MRERDCAGFVLNYNYPGLVSFAMFLSVSLILMQFLDFAKSLPTNITSAYGKRSKRVLRGFSRSTEIVMAFSDESLL